MKKNFLFKIILLQIIVLLVLSGCSPSRKPRNEKELEADLKNNGAFFSYCNVDIENFSVLKRITEVKDKSDIAYVEANIRSTDGSMTGTVSYVMEYTLYNEGWLLDKVTRYTDGTWDIDMPSESLILDAIRKESPYFEPYMDHLEKDYAEYKEGNSDHTKYFVDYSYSSYEDSFYAVACGRLTIALQNNGWEVYDHFINSEYNPTRTGLIPTINVDRALVNESLSREWDSWVNKVDGAVLNKDIVLLGNTFEPELQFSSWAVKFFGMYDYMIMEYYLELVFIFDNEKAEWVFSHTNFIKSRENWEPLFNTIWSCANPENGQRDCRVQIEYLATDDASIGNQVMWIDGLRYTFRKGRQLAIYSSDRHDLLIFTNNGGVVLWIDPAEGVYYIEKGEGSSENERVHTDFDIGDKSRFVRMHCEGAGSFTNPDINSDLLEGGTWETVN